MELKIRELDRSLLIEVQKNMVFDEDNPTFNKAFERHLKCSDILFNATFFREAYLSYLLSLECLLKDIFVLARAKVYGPDPMKSPAAIILISQKSNQKDIGKKDLSNLLKASKFNHDLASLIKLTKELFPEFDKQQPPTFATLVKATKVSLNWTTERYQDPENNKENWQKDCEEMRNALYDFIESDLKSLYPGLIK